MVALRRVAVVAVGVASAVAAAGHATLEAQPAASAFIGAQDPAWAPDGKRIAISALDTIWTLAPDGRQPAPLVTASLAGIEREPAWSPTARGSRSPPTAAPASTSSWRR